VTADHTPEREDRDDMSEPTTSWASGVPGRRDQGPPPSDRRPHPGAAERGSPERQSGGDVTARQPLTLGQLNDGIEPQFPTSDIPDLTAIAQVTFDCEIDRDLATQAPQHVCIQGSADDADRHQLGVTIQRGLMTVQTVTWTALTPRHWVLVVRADFHGTPVSLFTTKRPGRAHMELWPSYDTALAGVLRAEVDADRIVPGGLDANEGPPAGLLSKLPGFVWTPPYPGAVVGFLTHGVQMLAVSHLQGTGEHPPLVALARVPLPNP
jgi:hypothetical protein